LKATFRGFCEIPRLARNAPAVFEATKQFKAPWGEIVSESMVFTVPWLALEIPHLLQALNRMEIMVKRICDFMHYSASRPFMLAFDTDVLRDDCTLDHPIRLPLEEVDDVFDNGEQPSRACFRMLVLVARACLRDNYFSPMTELALATVSAYIVILQTFRDAPELADLVYQVPDLVPEIMALHTKLNDTVVSTLLEESWLPDAKVYGVATDRWLEFVVRVCEIARFDFAEMFDYVYPVSENVAKIVGHLPIGPDLVPHSPRVFPSSKMLRTSGDRMSSKNLMSLRDRKSSKNLMSLRDQASSKSLLSSGD
jgi:hypothetical protein